MAYGVPVIVSDKGGPREMVQHGRTGLITEARNAAELVEGIGRRMPDRMRRSRAGRESTLSFGMASRMGVWSSSERQWA
jgi:glycosyltransferase involved in cell wall biosynthesis